MNDKRRIKKEVKKLAKQKEYEKIYYQYGPKYFRKYVSSNYKEKDINKLRKEGKYIDIYTKYGKLDLETKIKERRERRGKKLHTKNGTISRWISYIKVISLGTVIGKLYMPIKTDIETINNKNKYEEQIEEYEKSIEEYAEQFDISEQSDLEIIMKCMYDLHNRIQGYKEPELDIVGYRGLDVMKEGGFGVCRNFAPNIADELNEINPEYNARLINLYWESDKLIKNNINSRIITEGGDIITDIRGEYIIETLGNEELRYWDNKLIQKTTTNEDSTIILYYEDGRITKEEIVRENERIQNEYDNEQKIRKKVICKGNDETTIIYYNDGREMSKDIKEERDGIKYYKKYIDGSLREYTEEAEDYYKMVLYYEDGHRLETIADRDKEENYYYSMYGDLYKFAILEDGYKTSIEYNANGEELLREMNKSDEENVYNRIKRLEEKRKETAQSKEKELERLREKRTLNHELVAVDIESDNITLLIDPTNLALGIYKDGEIIIFNEQNPEEASYLRGNILSEARYGGTKKFLQCPIDYIKSFREPTISMEEIEEKYGLDAQNRMIEKIEKDENKKSLREEIKIDSNITYDFENNVVTIINDKAQENEDVER